MPCSPKTLARRITSIKAFFRWLHQNGVLLIDPAEKVPQRTVISPLPVVLTPEEVELALEGQTRSAGRQSPTPAPTPCSRCCCIPGSKRASAWRSPRTTSNWKPPTGRSCSCAMPAHKTAIKNARSTCRRDWVETYHEYTAQYDLSERAVPWSQRRLEYLLEDLSVEAGLDKHRVVRHVPLDLRL